MTAQNSTVYDPKAKSVLDKVSAKADECSTIKANFSYSMENVMEKTKDTHEGSFISKGNKYVISLMGSDVYFDGKTRWTHLKDADEVNITEPDMSEENFLNPTYIFVFYKKGYKYKYVQETTVNGKKMHEIDLFPEKPEQKDVYKEKPKQKDFTRVKLLVEKETDQIYQVKVFGRDGTNYTITVTKLTPNEPIEDKKFAFDVAAHPDLEVIDLRD